MLITRIILLTGLAAVMLAAARDAHAQFDPYLPAQPQRSATDVTDVRVLTDVKRIAPGQTFHVVVLFKTSGAWHLYWKNPGAGAAAPSVRLTTPGDFEVKPTRFPRPKIINSPVGEMYCHAGEFALFVPVQAPQDLRADAVMLTADVSWAVCDDEICLIGNVARTIALETSSSVQRERDAEEIDPVAARHAARLPAQVKESDDAEAIFADGVLTIRGPAHGHTEAVFIPNGAMGVEYGEPTFTFAEGRFKATIEVKTNPRDFGRREPTVGGLIGLGEKVTDPAYEVDLPLNETSKHQSETSTNQQINKSLGERNETARFGRSDVLTFTGDTPCT